MTITITSGERVDRGVVGRRVLTCVQTIDVGRLTSDPVFLVPGAFVAVTGQGPRDSNESSKTTFEAALSLLLGDPGWNQRSTRFSAHACELLFDPPNAPAGARVRADTGYIAGVFVDAAEPGSGRLLAGGDRITVWVRLRRDADGPFEVRVGEGVQLARGDSHAERLSDAARIWSGLRGPGYGPRTYATALYGPGVTCLSYVSTRGGRAEQRDRTLLGSDVSQLSPEQIADQLVDLAGMRHLFDTETDQRRHYLELLERLERKRAAVAESRRGVDDLRDGLSRVTTSLDAVAAARQARDRYLSRSLLDTLDTLGELRDRHAAQQQRVAAAEEQVARVRARLDELEVGEVRSRATAARQRLERAAADRRPIAQCRADLDAQIRLACARVDDVDEAAARWSGRPADAIAAALKDARQRLREAVETVGAARARHREAAAHLEAVWQGTGGPAADRLAAAGIDSRLLHDAVELDPAARHRLEPLLHPFEGALCVPAADRGAAVEAVAGLSGTLLLAGDDGPLPVGVAAAPPGAAAFLRWLDRSAAPASAGAALPGAVVVGGFSQPTTGRDARVRAARAALDRAGDALDAAEGEATRHGTDEAALAAELETARAHTERARLREQIAGLRRELAEVDGRLAPLEAAVEAARGEAVRAEQQLADLQERRQEVADHLRTCQRQQAAEEAAVREIEKTAGRYQLGEALRRLARVAAPRRAAAAGAAAAGAHAVGDDVVADGAAGNQAGGGDPPAGDAGTDGEPGASPGEALLDGFDLRALDPLDLPEEPVVRVRAHAEAVLAGDARKAHSLQQRYREHITRLEERLGIEVATDS